MRKIYSLLLLVAMLLPSFAVAQNKAISKSYKSYYSYYKKESRILLPFAAAGLAQDKDDPATSPGRNYSVGVWFHPTGISTDSPGAGVIFRMGTGSHANNNGAANLLLSPNGNLNFSLNNDNGFGTGTYSVGNAPLNQWNYVLLVFDSANGKLRIYLNGQETVNDGTVSKFGYQWGDGVFQFFGMCYSGQFDEIQLFNKALTAGEAAAAYSDASKVDGLASLYTFDTLKEGTVGQFESVAGSVTDQVATYQMCTYDAYWDGGLVTLNNAEETQAYFTDGREIAAAEAVELYLAGCAFGENRVTLTATDGTNTYVSQEDAHMIEPGTTLTLSATAAEGYTFAGYVEYLNNAEKYFDSNSYVVSKANAGASVAAFAVSNEDMWDMTVVNEANVPLTLTDPWKRTVSNYNNLYSAGDAVEYKLTLGEIPADYIASTLEVKLGDEVLTAENGVYTIAAVEDATLTISLQSKQKFTITLEQPAVGGTVSASINGQEVVSGAEVNVGDVVTLSATPASGFSLVNFIVNGADYTESTVTVSESLVISAKFEEGFEYCVPEHYLGPSSTREFDRHSERYLNSINLNDGANQLTIEVGGKAGGPNTIWNDFTGTYTYVTNPGSTITFKSTGGGVWMNTFVYADFNNNGFDVADKLWDNFGGSGNAIATEFTVTLPEDLAYGTYRVRYIVDWNQNYGPCFWGQESAGTHYGECVVDFMIQVKSDDLDVARTITVASVNDAYGTVAITNPATEEKSISTVQKAVTVEATPADGYAFINWTNAAGEEVSTDATYVYTGTEDITLTANFGYTLSYFVGEGGSAAFMVNGQAVASDVVLAPETEVTINVTPGTDMQANIIVNGMAVNFTNNTYTFVMTSSTSVVVSFVDAVYTLTIEVEGDGEVKVTDAGDYKNGPSGNEYTNDSEITGLALKGFVKPAEGAELVYIGYEDEGNDATDLTSKVREVTAAGFEGWYFVALPKAKGNRVLTVEFTEVAGELEYCQPEPLAGRTVSGGKTKRTDRYVSSINLTDGENTATVEGTGYSWNRDVYADRTSTTFTTTAGKTVAVTVNGAGEWMNTYVFVDFDLNGFTAEDKVFSNYEGQEPAPDNTVEQTFSFNVPATVEPGDYRVRYILDWWNNFDPCVYGQEGSDNGEAVIDFILTVSDSTSGIGAIGIDPANGPVEYYNLQGVRVAAENLVPGFYVVRQGDKAAKVFINK